MAISRKVGVAGDLGMFLTGSSTIWSRIGKPICAVFVREFGLFRQVRDSGWARTLRLDGDWRADWGADFQLAQMVPSTSNSMEV